MLSSAYPNCDTAPEADSSAALTGPNAMKLPATANPTARIHVCFLFMRLASSVCRPSGRRLGTPPVTRTVLNSLPACATGMPDEAP